MSLLSLTRGYVATILEVFSIVFVVRLYSFFFYGMLFLFAALIKNDLSFFSLYLVAQFLVMRIGNVL